MDKEIIQLFIELFGQELSYNDNVEKAKVRHTDQDTLLSVDRLLSVTANNIRSANFLTSNINNVKSDRWRSRIGKISSGALNQTTYYPAHIVGTISRIGHLFEANLRFRSYEGKPLSISFRSREGYSFDFTIMYDKRRYIDG